MTLHNGHPSDTILQKCLSQFLAGEIPQIASVEVQSKRWGGWIKESVSIF